MVSGTDRDYKALVVRIAVGNREKLKGTGQTVQSSGRQWNWRGTL